MRTELRSKIIEICNKKIAAKGDNKNDNPELLMEAATWWIQIHELDHFVKASTIKKMIQDNL